MLSAQLASGKRPCAGTSEQLDKPGRRRALPGRRRTPRGNRAAPQRQWRASRSISSSPSPTTLPSAVSSPTALLTTCPPPASDSAYTVASRSSSPQCLRDVHRAARPTHLAVAAGSGCRTRWRRRCSSWPYARSFFSSPTVPESSRSRLLRAPLRWLRRRRRRRTRSGRLRCRSGRPRPTRSRCPSGWSRSAAPSLHLGLRSGRPHPP